MIVRDVVYDIFCDLRRQERMQYEDGSLKRHLVHAEMVRRFGDHVPTESRTREMMVEMMDWADYYLDMEEGADESA